VRGYGTARVNPWLRAPVQEALRLHPQHCRPARGTMATAGTRDVDAGQGNVLRGSNHLTSGCLTDSSNHTSTRVQSQIQQKPTVTWVMEGDGYRRQPLARGRMSLPGALCRRFPSPSPQPLASVPRPPLAPEALRSALGALQMRTLQATHSGCNFTVCSFMPASLPGPSPAAGGAGVVAGGYAKLRVCLCLLSPVLSVSPPGSTSWQVTEVSG
jgi:hypothetical protein